MSAHRLVAWSFRLVITILFAAVSTWAQFSASIQGSVTDPSGAAVPQAKITLENVSTHITATTTADAEGGYRFVSVAPGSTRYPWKLPAFQSRDRFDFETNQNLSVPLCSRLVRQRNHRGHRRKSLSIPPRHATNRPCKLRSWAACRLPDATCFPSLRLLQAS